MRRIVITGIGLITPLGSSSEYSWNRLLQSKSGIKRIPESLFDASDLTCKIAGLVPLEGEGSFQLGDLIKPKEARKSDKFIHYAIAAAEEAIRDSMWDPQNEEDKDRTGVLVGSGIGGLIAIENTASVLQESGPKRVSPFFIPASLINLASGHISIRHGFTGPNHSVVTACSTGAHAIGDAGRIIKDGDADVMICGGAEGAICKLGVAGFASARALSTRYNDTPEDASRPWDEGRDGFVMGEGAGIVILEEYEHAKKRGAKIYGELIGYGLTGDAYHMTAPEPTGRGAVKAMQMAIKKANISCEEIDYINAHGTSTPLGDLIEIKALKQVFNKHAHKLAISSTKSSIGHLLGAAGSVEAIFSLLALQNNVIPPTLNLTNPSEGCDLNLVPNNPIEKQLNVVMSNSFGFGGTNASLIFRKI